MEPKEFKSTRAGKPILIRAGYWAFLPNPLPPKIDWSTTLVSTLGEAERELGRLSALLTSFPFPRLLVQPFIRNEAVISSRIEGTRASLVDVLKFEIAQLSFLESTGDVREVHNYVSALNYGLERLKSLPVSVRLFRELHAKLMENVRGGLLTPGELRRSQNWIGPVGSTISTAPYVPPPVEYMNDSLSNMEEFIHSNTTIPRLVQAGMIHYQFEAIHPFLDGNGRLGRLLIALLFCEWGLLTQPLLNLSTYFEHYRQEYYDHLLDVSREGKWEAWLLFFLRGIGEQSRESYFRLEKLRNIRTSYQDIVEKERNSSRMAAVVDFLFSRPILSINQLADGLNIPFKTAQSYLVKLENAGVLREVTGYTRNRIYQADEIFVVIQGNDD